MLLITCLSSCERQRTSRPVGTVVDSSPETSTSTSEPDTDETTAGSSSTDTTPTYALLEGVPYLTRLSLDLRGVRPTSDEIAWVQEDPEAIDALIDEYLYDARFSTRMGWLWNDVFHTAIWAADYNRFGDWDFEQWHAVGQEPIKLLEAIVEQDLPLSTLVTSDQLLMNRALAAEWDAPYPGDGDDWVWTTYDDGRPMAGILSSTSFWLRYTADVVNKNRLRANSLATIFLCSSFLEREGSFTFDISAESLTEVETAVETEQACLSCHAALDPLASYFWGFSPKSDSSDQERYVKYSRFEADSMIAVRPAAYFGVPGSDLVDLGTKIAADPRFASCSVDHIYSGLVGHAPTTIAERDALADAFVEDDLVVRDLVRRVVKTAAYRRADERVLTPEQLSSALSDALGLSESTNAEDGLGPLAWSSEHRVLGGGTDDWQVLFRNRTPSVGQQIMLAWAARQGVPAALADDVMRAESDRQLMLVSSSETNESAIRDALVQLHLRFLSEPIGPDDAKIDRLYDLWMASEVEGGRDAAWLTVLTALVRHPRSVMY